MGKENGHSQTCPLIAISIVSAVGATAATIVYYSNNYSQSNKGTKHGVAGEGEDDGNDKLASSRSIGTVGSIYSPEFIKAVQPLFDCHMGCENMGPLLYSLIRFVKSSLVLEIGAGYTSIYLLQAIYDNDMELRQIQKQHQRHQLATGLQEKEKDQSDIENMYVGSVDVTQRNRPCLHMMDNMEHESTTAHMVQDVARMLDTDLYLKAVVADCFTHEPHRHQDVPDKQSRLLYDFVWLDGITTDERFPALFDKFWKHHLKLGGYIAVHSTLTNTVTRRWMTNLIDQMEQRRAMKLVQFDVLPTGPHVQWESLAPKLLTALQQQQESITLAGDKAQVEWQEDGYQVQDIGFGIQKLRLFALVVSLDVASEVAERIKTKQHVYLLGGENNSSNGNVENDFISSTEVVVDSPSSSSPVSQSYLHYCSFWEPHKRFQNSFTIFQKRNATYHEPIHSWSP